MGAGPSNISGDARKGKQLQELIRDLLASAGGQLRKQMDSVLGAVDIL